MEKTISYLNSKTWYRFIKQFFIKLILVLSVYFVWSLILKDVDPYILDSGPFFAIPFTIVTIYLWRKINKMGGKTLNKIEAAFIKVVLILSVYAIWVIILNDAKQDVFNLIFDMFDSLRYAYFFNQDFLYAVPLTIVSIYGWNVLTKKICVS